MEVLPLFWGYTVTSGKSQLCFSLAGSGEPKQARHRLWVHPGPSEGLGTQGLRPRAASPRSAPRTGLRAQRGSHDLRFCQQQGTQEPTCTLGNNCYPLQNQEGTQGRPLMPPHEAHTSSCALTLPPRAPHLQTGQVSHPDKRQASREERRGRRGGERPEEGWSPVVPQLGPGPSGRHRKESGGWHPQGTK